MPIPPLVQPRTRRSLRAWVALGGRGWAALALALAGVGASAGEAQAYCRTHVCDPSTSTCPTDDLGCPGGGAELSWPAMSVPYALQQSASSQVDFATFQRVAEASFGAWPAVDCGGGQKPSFQYQDAGGVTCSNPSCPISDSDGVNLVVFRDAKWPYAGAFNTFALTTVTFGTETGHIVDADMEINSTEQMHITTTDHGINVDLQSVMTHEAGHFLGMAHSPVEKATMFALYSPGTDALRVLAPDDVEGMCAIYPPGQDREAQDTSSSGCATGATGAGGGAWALLAGALAVVVGGLRRAAGPATRRA